MLEVSKELSIRDAFAVKADDALPFQVGVLSPPSRFHSRFYEMV